MVKLTKLKRLEKAKVKLKAKKLPKGQNVTDTSFKAKKIIIPGQLKTSNEQEIHTRKKLNIQELLAHLRHHNVSMRREGLSGLTELIAKYEDDIIKLHLPKVIDGVSSLVLDLEREIRKAAFKLIETILSKISSEQIEPHFDILRTYMSCAMTHINVSVREDSLLLLDLLLNECPSMMVRKADEVLPVFLNMVSSARNNSEHGRTLSVHLNNKLISVQWRMRVFARLTKYFCAIVGVKEKESRTLNMDTENNTENKSKIVNWSDTSPFYAAEFLTFKHEICNLPSVFTYSTVTEENAGQNTVNQEKTLKEHVASLMPVLFEAWMEVAPQKEVNILNEDAAGMLQYILETLHHVWDCLQYWEEETNINNLTSWFIKSYQKTILKAFFPCFPFSLEEKVFIPKVTSPKQFYKSQKSLSRNISSSRNCTQQNLYLCYLMANIDSGYGEVRRSMIDYLNSCILKWDDLMLLPILEKVLRTFIMDNKNSRSKIEILLSVVSKYQDLSAPLKLRQTLFSLLCDFVLQPRYHQDLRCKGFEKWISDLPCTLFQSEVPMKTLKTLSSLASRNNEIFMIGLKKQAQSIINCLCEMEITGNSTPFEGQKMILNILFHVVDSDCFDDLLKRISNSEDHKELVSYIINLKELYKFVNSVHTQVIPKVS